MWRRWLTAVRLYALHHEFCDMPVWQSSEFRVLRHAEFPVLFHVCCNTAVPSWRLAPLLSIATCSNALLGRLRHALLLKPTHSNLVYQYGDCGSGGSGCLTFICLTSHPHCSSFVCRRKLPCG